MGQRRIRLLLSVWIIGCVATEEDRKFSVTIETVQVNDGDRAEPSGSSGHQIQVKEENQEQDVDKAEPKNLHTAPRTLNDDFQGCCGVKSSSTSIRSTEPIVRNGDPDARMNQDRVYNPRFGSPDDRYGWQNVNKVQGLPDRYNQRPASSDNNYAGTTRPGTSYGAANYGDNRPHGSAIYSTKPAYGVGPYGGEAAEFGPDTHGYQDVVPPPYPNNVNINTQKAVALKALAGVALIGAAAALATNPALMPLGMISGRRKRSLSDPKSADSNHPFKFLDHFISQLKSQNGGLDFSVTPSCVARLTCEVQRDYIADLKQSEQKFTGDKKVLQEMESWFIDLIRRNVLDVDYVSAELKKLIKLAVSVGSENRDCRIFSCDMVKNE